MILRPLPRGPLVIPAAALVLVLSACGDSSGPAVPAQVLITAGDQQVVPVGEGAPIPLSVRVTTQGGGAVGGEEVVWRVASGNAEIDPDTSSTDASGIATTTVRMGQSAGEVTVTATVRDLPPATFVLEAAAGAATSVVVIAGNNQVGAVGETLPDPVTVEARDRYGNPVPGATIAFSASIGSLSPASVSTDAQGRASAAWTLPTTPGEHGALASLAGSSAGATLKATATAGAPSTLEKVSGDAQQAPPGSALGEALVVRVLDSFGNPVPGTAVAFATPDGGSFGASAPVTGQSGLAQTTWTLGSDETRVDQTATATVAGLGSVTFSAIANDPCDDVADYTLGSSIQGELTTLDCSASWGSFTDIYRMELSEQRIFDLSMGSSAFSAGLVVMPPGIFAAAGGASEFTFSMVGAPAVYGLFPTSENAGATGPYTLSSTLRDAIPAGCELILFAGSVQFPGAVTAADCDPIPDLQVSGRHDEIWTVLMPGTVGASMTSDAFDPVLVLIEITQTVSVVATAQGQAGQQPATLEHTVPQAALYVLIASAPDSTTTGAYQLATSVQATDAVAVPGSGAERTMPFRLPVPGMLRRGPGARD
ncbi:MAG TPA: Ig-like domain-containing protein [Longimicrobiales bacterium]|nr:Ig-like domain-containing protein [Longimicrobiales bacterium]